MSDSWRYFTSLGSSSMAAGCRWSFRLSFQQADAEAMLTAGKFMADCHGYRHNEWYVVDEGMQQWCLWGWGWGWRDVGRVLGESRSRDDWHQHCFPRVSRPLAPLAWRGRPFLIWSQPTIKLTASAPRLRDLSHYSFNQFDAEAVPPYWFRSGEILFSLFYIEL